MKLYKVTLLADERAELEAITRKGSHQSQKVINALILNHSKSTILNVPSAAKYRTPDALHQAPVTTYLNKM